MSTNAVIAIATDNNKNEMFDFIKRLFGEGTVKIQFAAVDRQNKVVKGTAKLPYIGEYDEDDVLRHIKNTLWVDHDLKVTGAEVVGHLVQR